MVNYKCIRCGYDTTDKAKIKLHLNRKFMCKPILNNVSLDLYKERILNGEEINLGANLIESSMSNTIKPQNYLFITTKKTTEIPQKTTEILYPSTKKTQLNTIKNSNKCKFCEKDFSRKDALNRHLKTCKEKKEDDEDKANLLNLVDMLNEQLQEQREQLKEQRNEFKEELNKRDEQITQLIKKAGVNIGTQNIQNNIKLVAYKDTDLSHLTDKDYLQCLNRSNMVIPNLIKRIHFNPKKPENQNIYISNIKNKYVMIYDGGKWNLHNREDTIDDLIDTNEIVIEQKLEEWMENGKEYPEIMKKFNRYLEKKEKDDVKNAIKEEIKLILFNNRKILEAK